MSEIIYSQIGEPIGATQSDPSEDIYKVRDDFKRACDEYEWKTFPTRYFVDVQSFPRRFYAGFQEDGYVVLVNVERPTEPVYGMPGHFLDKLFDDDRFQEIGITLDKNYSPTRLRLKLRR